MNNRDRVRILNNSLNYVRPSNRTGSHLNCIRLSPNKHQDRHNKKMIERCLEYLYTGTPFITEPIFLNGERADILLPTIPLIEEIMISETKERFDKKNYPFRIVKIKDVKRRNL